MLVLLLTLALTATPDPEARGRVIDAVTRQPITGADVTVIGRSGAVRTDRDGGFVWTSLPEGPIVVIVTLRDGRVARPIEIDAAQRTASPIVIEVTPAVTEAITVTGIAPTIDTAPGAATRLVTGADIELRHPLTIAGALESIPGVSFVGDGQSPAPVLRGMARGRTLILVDGSRASTEKRTGATASFLDPIVVRSIDVARGPASVAYGSEAFGGVIAVSTRRPIRDARWHARFSGTGGAGIPEGSGDLEVSTGYGHGGVLVGVRARRFDDYDSPDGRVPNSSWEDRGVRLAWEHDAGSTSIALGWQSDIGRDQGRPRSDNDTIQAAVPKDDSHRFTTSIVRPSLWGLRQVRVDALIGSASQQVTQDRLAAPGRAGTLDRSDLEFNDAQLRVTAESGTAAVTWRGGLDLQGRYDFHARDTSSTYTTAGTITASTEVVSAESARRWDTGLFVEAEAPIGSRLRASGGVRADTVSSHNRGGYFGTRSITNSAVAGVAAITVRVAGPLTMTAQLARGFRDPLLSDRFYRGPVGRGVIEGNPDLEPETSRQFDVTARVVTPRARVSMAVYDYRIHDLIERYTAGPNLFLFRNRGRAVIHGVEIEGQLPLWRGFSLEAGGQISDGHDADTDAPIDDIAPESASLLFRYESSARPYSGYVRIAAAATRDEPGPSEVTTPGYTVVDVGARWRLTRGLEVRGVLRNLFDAAYASSSGPRFVLAPGRHGSITVAVQF